MLDVLTDSALLSTCVVKASPIKKCLGVNASRQSGSFDKGVSGREFRIASISIMIVSNSSCVRFSVDTIRTKRRFADFTAASHKPPKCGALGGMKLK